MTNPFRRFVIYQLNFILRVFILYKRITKFLILKFEAVA